MQSVETIKDLGINYMQGLGTMPKKYYLLNDRIDIIQKQLKQKLRNKKDKKKVDELINTIMKTSTFESDEQFVSGFILATQIMAEALTHKL